MRLFWQLTVLCTVVTWADSALAQRRPIADDTLGNERTIVGPDENIRERTSNRIRGGARRGDNLFHSFREFGIDPGRAVYFDDPGVQNIFSRVTGGNASEILGRLGVLGNANLFLLNPNGIFFGPNASLDVRGAFVGSTANAVQFGDQGFFNVSDPNAPPLLTVQPSAFLFNQLNPRPIENQSRAPLGDDGLGNQVSGLLVPNGQNLVLLGGNIINSGNLNTFGGRVELGSVAGIGTVGFNPDGSLSFPADVTRADVFITDGARIDVASNGGGNIAIHARNINILNGSLQIGIFPGLGTVDSQAGDIILNGTGEIRVEQSSLITNNVEANAIGNGGNINVTAGSLFVTDGASLQTLTRGQGDAGNVIINADNQVVFDNGTAFSTVEAGGEGTGGNIEIDTNALEVLNRAQLIASTRGQGDAGNVIISAGDRVVFDNSNASSRVDAEGIGKGGNVQINTGILEVLNRAQLIASTRGQGDAGNVIISAGDRIVFNDSNAFSSVETGGMGSGGNVQINTNTLEIRSGAALVAGTQGQGDAGNVIISAGDRVVFDNSNAFSRVEINGMGSGGNVQIVTGSLEVLNGSQLIANTLGEGDAGNVIINADDRVVFDNSKAFSSVEAGGEGSGGNVQIVTGSLEVRSGAALVAGTRGQGDAGNVIINADNQVVFDNGVASSRVEAEGMGRGGNVQINVSTLEVLNRAQLIASTFGQGDAGNVIINADNQVVFDNGVASSRVNIGGEGRGGNVQINTNTLEVLNGSQLIANTLGQGDAGNVIISAGDRVVFDNSNAFSSVEAGGVGRGGNVQIITGSLEVRNRGQLAASTRGQGDAGNVKIDADNRVVFDNGVASSRVNIGGEGRGGNVQIVNASAVEVRNRGQLIASTEGQGDAGNVIINADNQVVFNDSNAFSSVETGGEGRGGNVQINTNTLEVRNGAALIASTRGQGDAGDVLIDVANQVMFDNGNAFSSVETGGEGRGGNVQINTNTLEVRNGAALIASTRGQGDAGNVIINADDWVSLEGVGNNGFSSGLFTSTFEGATGRGGNITVHADSIRLTDGAVVNAQTYNDFRGGDITLNANTFEATGGGQVVTTTLDGGRAGNINLDVTDHITLSGFDSNYAERSNEFETIVSNQGEASGLFANTSLNSSGRGGTIRIRTGELDISDRAGVVVNSQGTGVAGNIDITAQSVLLDRGNLTAETNTVDGGNITLRELGLLRLRNNSLISATAGIEGDEGDGGNITIDADLIVASPYEDSDISANATEGNGGRVEITTEGLFGIEAREAKTEYSDITASSEQGVQGTVNINQPDTDPSDGLVELPENVVDASDQIAQTCPSDGDLDALGEFVVTGRGGLPPDPAEIVGGEVVLNQLSSLESNSSSENRATNRQLVPSIASASANSHSTEASIVEAQGWVVDAEGKVNLVAEASTVEPYSATFVPISCPDSE